MPRWVRRDRTFPGRDQNLGIAKKPSGVTKTMLPVCPGVRPDANQTSVAETILLDCP